ncbi:hypothetical protein MMC30_003734 [Trapelia coarctata]|nr:hypothetical protein [Trapelia coarctata]
MGRNRRGGRGAAAFSPRGGGLNGGSGGNSHSNGRRQHFSLAEEARNTEERHHSWNSDLRLRHTQISFISAGASGNSIPPEEATAKQVSTLSVAEEDAATAESELSMANMSIQSHFTPPAAPFESKAPIVKGTPIQLSETNETHMPPSEESNAMFVIDSRGFDQRVETGLPPPVLPRSPSPAPSDSSEEVVLFRGRGTSGQGRREVPIRSVSINQDQLSSKTDPTNPARSSSAGFGVPDPGPRRQVSEAEVQPNDLESAQLPIDMTKKTGEPTRRGPRHSRCSRKQAGKQKEEDDGIADYIENLQANQEEYADNIGITSNLTDLDSGVWQDEPDEWPLDDEPNIRPSADWSEDDLQDLNDISTSSEILEAVESILSRRERPAGRQYLVVWKGYTTDDARWVPHSSLSHPTASELIAVFDAREELAQRFQTSGDEADSDSGSDDELARALEEELDELKDEEDLLERRKARMTDEQIARRLGKQEELGLGSAEIMLFDGGEMGDSYSDENIENLREQAAKYNSARVPGKRGRRKQGGPFVSASAFADVLDVDPHNEFDIMDHERPSLRKVPKGRCGALPLELSDPELEASMLLAWENDRMKKKIQKQQREELRAQGLLGKNGIVDMKAKYTEGMPIAALKAELKDFLESDRESISFPPMDKKVRVLIHNYANAFGLKSRSMGVGTNRYPNIYKTRRTHSYSDAMFDRVQARFDRVGFLPRMDKGKKRDRGDRNAGPRHGGGGIMAAVSYRDGEIVGHMAPELGTENKGRAMLEKMGWSTGTALGALNNKGIMEPVAHVVKTTKAGLG